MCGICGFLAAAGRPDPALVAEMAEALVHRGPDEGSLRACGPCLLASRRLRVLDPIGGCQPAVNEDGSVLCVFNGEIYNFRELRQELSGGRHRIPGSGDTALLPHLYEEHGPAFVERLSGMFALALWDARRERLLLARDRVGKKPLLWTRLPDGSLAFASEVKALLRLPALRAEVEPAAVDAFLALGYVPGGTGLRGVEKLAPGHLLLAQAGSLRIERYARLRPLSARGEQEWLALVRERVTAAVRRRLVADVPLGVLLSGGLDSSVVVAVAAQATAEPLRTFTVGFGHRRYDERSYARAVAQRYGCAHEEVVLEESVADLLPQLAAAYDEPHGDDAALPLFLICRAARERVTVALTGDGGDEAFGGYDRYRAHAWARRAALPGVGVLARGLGALGGERRSRSARVARFLAACAAPAQERYARLVEVFPASLRRRLLEPEFVAEPAPTAALLGAPRLPGLAGLQLLDLERYLPDDLLLKADIASMAHSLELRSPFLDWEVLEVGISLPDALKLRGRRGKEALRRAFAEALPPPVASRAKSGFGVPLADWFRGELRDLAGDLLLEGARRRGQLRPQAVEALLREHARGRADHGHRLWCLLMLELWQRTHLEARPARAEALALR